MWVAGGRSLQLDDGLDLRRKADRELANNSASGRPTHCNLVLMNKMRRKKNDVKLLKNDLHQPSTLLDQAKLSEQLDAGRYKSTIIGAAQSVEYPAIPSGPWSSGYAQLPPEEPLGYSMSDVEPCGTPAEIEASLAVSERAPSDRFPSDVDDGTIPSAAPPRPTLRMRRLG
jgi:hypothetical protein